MNIGIFGENTACNYLKKHKYKILSRNYRKPYGEIDIVARKGETVVFVEVKTRKNAEYGLPCEAVTLQKRRKIIQTAYAYIAEEQLDDNYRFDIIEVYHEGEKVLSVRHIQNAFGLE